MYNRIKINQTDLLEFYCDHLKKVLLPFWLERGIDHQYGGYFTCFDNTGENLLSTDKFTWSQGRMVWIFSKLSTMDCFGKDEREKYLSLARSGAEFLMQNCLLENGNCTFIMTREGVPKPQIPGQQCDSSIYADCFAILGLSRYAAVCGDRKALQFAKSLYKWVITRFESNNYKSLPYPPVPGYKTPPMIVLNLSQEMALALEKFNDDEYIIADNKADECMHETMDHFITEDYIRHEMKDINGSFTLDTLLGRYVNPGHTIEDMWFEMYQAVKKDNHEIILKAAEVIRKTFEIGWDNEYGGLFLFVDRDGGMPGGSIKGIENEVMVQKVLNDWSSKLWWPHSEALYTTLLAFSLTGDESLLELYRTVHQYTFKTFPNPDRTIGEWIQIRDRKGIPENRIVALPVKDPFHIIRNVILIIELLQGLKDGLKVKDIILTRRNKNGNTL